MTEGYEFMRDLPKKRRFRLRQFRKMDQCLRAALRRAHGSHLRWETIVATKAGVTYPFEP